MQALIERARARAASAGEMPLRAGPVGWDLPDSVRTAIREDIESGVYADAAREATAGDPEKFQR